MMNTVSMYKIMETLGICSYLEEETNNPLYVVIDGKPYNIKGFYEVGLSTSRDTPHGIYLEVGGRYNASTPED